MSPAADQITEERVFARYAADADPTAPVQYVPRSVDAVAASVVRARVRRVTRDEHGDIIEEIEVQHFYEIGEDGSITRLADEDGGA